MRNQSDLIASVPFSRFEVAGRTPAQVVEALLAKRIVASTSPYAVPYARLAAGVMNTEDEVDRALEAVGEIARG